MLGFDVFRFPRAVPSDSAANAIDSFPSLQLNGTDGDVKNPSLVWQADADCTAVDPAGSFFCRLDDSHGRNLRSTCNGSARKERLEKICQPNSLMQQTFNGRGHLPDCRVLLDAAEMLNPLTARPRNAIHVITQQIDNHHIFSSVFGVLSQPGSLLSILL